MSENLVINGVTYNNVESLSLTNIDGKQVQFFVGSVGYSDIPTYHYIESARVVDNILAFKAAHPNNLIFGAISDIHILNNNETYEEKSKTGIKHAAFALETVGAMAECDFIANLGDNCWENGIDSDNAYIGAQYSVNALKNAFTRLTRYNLVGNHDKSDDTQKQFNLIGSYNEFDDYGTTQIRGFGYKDYIDKKVRVIVLNTCDYLNASGGCALSYEQKDFLMRALDLSAKTDYADWQILLLSHIPLDWNGGDYNYYADLQTILNAYEDGTTASITVTSSYALNETPSNYSTYSNGSLVYDYSGKNAAKIIANIHGHVHTNVVSKIANTNIARVATANTNPDLNKTESYADYGDYSITSTEAAKIVKVSGTAKDTSATFYCIDLDEQIIYAYGYGADIDREIVYTSAPTYNVTYNLTNCESSNTSTVVTENSEYTATITPDTDATIDSVIITMSGVDITSTAYADGVISIANVTGDIVITVVASVPAWSETVSDMVVAPRSSWNYDSNSNTISLAAANYRFAIGVSTANDFGYTDRESNLIYVMPIPAKASKVIVNNIDGVEYEYAFSLYNVVDGALVKVYDSEWITGTEYTWIAGTAQYITIMTDTVDDSNVPWGYDDSQVTVEFSNGGTDTGGDSGNTPTYTNIIDTVGTENNVRLRSGGATAESDGFASNYFPVSAGDVIRVSFPNGARGSIASNGQYCCLYSDTNGTIAAYYNGDTSATVLKNATDTGYEIHIPTSVTCSYARVAGAPAGAYDGWIVTVNEPIE